MNLKLGRLNDYFMVATIFDGCQKSFGIAGGQAVEYF